ELKPFRAEFDRIINDRQYILSSMAQGAEKAAARAERTLSKVMKKIGFVGLR
ncbi:MAG: tryptophan--tRNA ligase, partial [Clostridiales bacterium]|nr:tryptophan--tRNA ligase [Clostridiales bacterium]